MTAIAGTDAFDETPNPALLTPATRNFKGKPLAPYTFGRRIISRTVLRGDLDPADQVWTLAVIFILTLGEDEAREALYDVGRFKVNLFRWIESLELPDYAVAVNLADEILAEARSAEVKTVQTPGAALPEKKT